ncbi:MAG TPA: glycoside hydrolase, partial [Blastocatellia bacterium]|nr:glycoside hydrolase [Blastocatellia bacterium]
MKQFAFLCIAVFCIASAQSGSTQASASPGTHDGRFVFDVPGVIGRSAVVLGKPNLEPSEAMPVGNGRLGVAVWSAEGFTAQLNRADTMPGRLSPGHVVIPGLAALTHAKDYAGRLDLYRGEFREQGGGMTATAYVEPDTDALIVAVTGADPNQAQTAALKLWAPRSPTAAAEGRTGSLAESWVDDTNPGASGRAFGTLSAITAEGVGVAATVTEPRTITVTFRPFPDGHFRVRVAVPHFDGSGDTKAVAGRDLAPQPDAAHASWWAGFWKRAAMIKITSKDGAG